MRAFGRGAARGEEYPAARGETLSSVPAGRGRVPAGGCPALRVGGEHGPRKSNAERRNIHVPPKPSEPPRAARKPRESVYALMSCIDAVERLENEHDRARVIETLSIYFGVR
jgi:hypothetical protein